MIGWMEETLRTMWALVLLTMSAASIGAEEPKASAPPKYRMDVVYMLETASSEAPPESIIVVGNFGFRSVAALKRFLAGLPQGAVVEWTPGCVRLGGELLSSVEELEDFRKFCKQEGIELVIHMSG